MSDDRFPQLTRRKMIGNVGIGLAAAALPTVSQGKISAADPQGLQDPTGKYPKPRFKAQSQPWPGLASQMDPRPDHGETS
jgi:hypothetical protein